MLIDPAHLTQHSMPAASSRQAEKAAWAERDPWLISFLDVMMVLVTMLVLLLSYDRLMSMEASGLTEAATVVVKPELESVFEDVRDEQAFLDQLYIGDLKGRVDVSVEHQQVKLGIHEEILFFAGDAALSHSGAEVLQELAHMLRDRPWLITVEGHTDNQPIATPRYPSNWELSAARATQVTRYLIDQGVTSERLRAVGYADTRPRDRNDRPEGRANNRRVELVLSVPEKSG